MQFWAGCTSTRARYTGESQQMLELHGCRPRCDLHMIHCRRAGTRCTLLVSLSKLGHVVNNAFRTMNNKAPGQLPAAGPGTCWGGTVRARVCAYVLAYVWCSGLARPSAPAPRHAFGRRGVTPAPRLELCVRWYLLRPRWVPCWLICAWCSGGTRRGLMCVWYLR